MSGRVFASMPGNERMAASLAEQAGAEFLRVDVHRFPDREARVRITGNVENKRVDLVCTLADPDPQFLSLVFAAETMREMRAEGLHLIAPYLAYMRQDARFGPGEAVASTHFASLLSQYFDSVTTIDPHLHRRRDLGEIFAVPARVGHAAPLIGRWIAEHVSHPVVIGPDAESEQWVAEVAARAGSPYVVLAKTRSGDRNVQIAVPDLRVWASHTPVLVDDLVSSGQTMIEAVKQVHEQIPARHYCIVVHPLFADSSYETLVECAAAVVSTDTIPHPSNAIGVAALLL